MATKFKAKIQPVKTGNKLVSNSAISGVNNYINGIAFSVAYPSLN